MRLTREQADDLRLRKPHLFSDAPQQSRTSPLREGGAAGKPVAAVGARRIRQDTKPLMNKLEAEWHEKIKGLYPNFPKVRIQAMRFRLSRSSWYKPDFTCSLWPDGPHGPIAWEVKGPHAFRGGLENLKMAASLYPEIRWVLVWKVAGEWQQQVVLP